ncbi:hypothetical protein [Bacillus sp. FJAT-50079]|uniref:hypothetical protein n=1 Tax=Bacillus sp. FJAT-50079 TaxID=2833577 RepID=UPI001BC91A60|nr:hypothetical protein [Bacillus sp. FJAT-50079]MBS4208957.1 hypothetical protein [Bacillus sp. FJAT-50079]
MNKKKKERPTVKIKINGEEHDYNENVIINHWQTADEEASAAADEQADEKEFDWVLPETNVQEVPKFHKVNHASKRRASFFTASLPRKFAPGLPVLIISIITAIAVGLLLGVLLLKMMKDVEPKSALVEETKVAENTNETPVEGNSSAYSMELPSFIVPVLQANVYTASEGAEQFLKELSERGISSTNLSMDGMYYVLVGSADTYTTVKSLATHVQTKEELIVYPKEITLKGGGELTFPSEDEARQFTAEHEVFLKLAGEAASGLLTGKVNADILVEIDKVLQAGSEKNNVEETIKELHTKLVAAHSHLASFSNNSADAGKVNDAQQALLEYIVLYHDASS